MKKGIIITIALCVVLFGGFFFASETFFKAENEENAIIDNGIYIGGINVSGMTTQQATEALNACVDKMKEQTIVLLGPKGNLELTLGEMGLKADVKSAVEHASGTAKASNLITRFLLLKELEVENAVIELKVSIDKQAVGNLIHKELEKLNIDAVDSGLKKEGDKFIFIAGQTGEEVDIVTSVNNLSDMIQIDGKDGNIEKIEFALSSETIAPRGTEEELLLVKDLLGTFSTDFSSSNEGRKKNVTNGCAKINGTLLYPGDTFSAYKATSPYNAANGYGIGGAYSGGKLVESMGGGICQVSTTLYNAALRAELKITQRNAHSMTVSYVDPSVDAAIAGTYKDLKFRNDYDFPIYIEGYCKKGILTFNVYGVEKRDANRTIRFENEILTVNDPDTIYTLSSKVALGTYKKESSEYIGYTAKLWKIISVDGVDVDKVQVNKSTYKASAKEVTIGTKGATAEQLATIKAALETKDDDYIKQVVKNIKNPPAPAPEPTPEPENPPASEEAPSDSEGEQAGAQTL